MDIVKQTAAYETVRVRFEQDACFIQIHRPHANNTINERLVRECREVLGLCEESIKIVVLEGSPEVFCFGADFKEIEQGADGRRLPRPQDAAALYDLWLQLAGGPYVTIAHVRGKANAGGIGFVAACDLVLCEEKAVFSLSELLFGLMPACVLPFLIRRVGVAKANVMALTTQSISARQAQEWGLVDAREDNSENLLRKQLLRLRRLSKASIADYKYYVGTLDDALVRAKPDAVQANLQVFSDPRNLERISRYVKTGLFPWEIA
jgi:polyketide biosynthesis enoyl-CoA hydratase PksH